MAEPEDTFLALVDALRRRGVRFVLIGVAGANYYARSGGGVFVTEDFDLFLPPDPTNTQRAWSASESLDLELWVGDEPLDRPRDLALARAICERRALVRISGHGLAADLTMVMGGCSFAQVYLKRRDFRVRGVRVPVASLRDIVESKAAAGRPKDRLFLATHEEALQDLMKPPRATARRVNASKRSRSGPPTS